MSAEMIGHLELSGLDLPASLEVVVGYHRVRVVLTDDNLTVYSAITPPKVIPIPDDAP